MSDLQNLTPANTYKGLLQVGDYTNGVDSTVKAVLDGEGTTSALAIGTTKVGINTTSPTQELDVNGDIVSTTLTTSGAVTAGSVSTSGAVTGGSLDVSGNVVADEYALDQTGSSSSAVAIHAPATNELAIRTNSTEAMRIDSSGQVGIGTAFPSSKVTVSEADGATLTLRRNSAVGVLDDLIGKIDFYNNDTSVPGARITATVGAYVKETAGGTYLVLNTAPNGGSNTERMRIDSDGNVGIGTVSPSAPLDVSSTTGGVIMPRMTTTQRTAISSPTPGEMVYDTDLNKFYGYTSSGWTALH